MARKAADLDLALGVLAGPEGRDSKAYRLSLPEPRHRRLAHYRVFVLTDHPAAAVDDEIAGAIDALGTNLERIGASVSRHSDLLPSLGDSQALFDRFVRVGEAARTGSNGPPGATVRDHFDCLLEQEALRRRWDEFFTEFDVLIAPCYAVPAFRHFSQPDPWPGRNRTLRINGRDVPFAPQHAWPLLAGMPRLPATAAPVGRTHCGLPIGAQFVGPFLEDRTTIAFAGRVAKELGIGACVAHRAGAVEGTDLLR